VQAALRGKSGVMVAIERISDQPYRWSLGLVPLSRVASREHMLPRGFISRDGFGITARARAYLQPLIRGEAGLKFSNGLPAYVRLKNVSIKKKLAPFEG
jgi:6-phosphofructokinase 1